MCDLTPLRRDGTRLLHFQKTGLFSFPQKRRVSFLKWSGALVCIDSSAADTVAMHESCHMQMSHTGYTNKSFHICMCNVTYQEHFRCGNCSRTRKLSRFSGKHVRVYVCIYVIYKYVYIYVYIYVCMYVYS